MDTLEITIGQKLEGLGIEETSFHPEPYTYIVSLSPFLFVVVLQANWTRKEIRNFSKRLHLGIAEIDDLTDFVFDFKEFLLVDIFFNPQQKPFNLYQPFSPDDGMAFHIILVDDNAVVKSQRLVSLTSENSNVLKDVLNEQIALGLSLDEYNKRLENIYKTMSISEVKANCFIEEKFFK